MVATASGAHAAEMSATRRWDSVCRIRSSCSSLAIHYCCLFSFSLPWSLSVHLRRPSFAPEAPLPICPSAPGAIFLRPFPFSAVPCRSSALQEGFSPLRKIDPDMELVENAITSHQIPGGR